MIFKSHQINLDPEPYRCASSGRRDGRVHGDPECDDCTLDPRPEFEPTRDPHPWLITGDGLTEADDYRIASLDWTSFWDWDTQEGHYRPRRERFDTPVNPILVDCRSYWAHHGDKLTAWHAMEYLNICAIEKMDATPEQIDHARRVLTRLAQWNPTTPTKGA